MSFLAVPGGPGAKAGRIPLTFSRPFTEGDPARLVVSNEESQTSSRNEPAPRRGFLSRALTIVILAVVILSLVAGSIYMLWVQPVTRENRALADRLATAVAEGEALQGQVDRAGLRLLLLAALVDVNSARVSLAQADPESAAANLDSIRRNLLTLESRLTGDPAGAVGQMRDRLTLVSSEIATDTFAAQRDLEVLANGLSELAAELEGN